METTCSYFETKVLGLDSAWSFADTEINLNNTLSNYYSFSENHQCSFDTIIHNKPGETVYLNFSGTLFIGNLSLDHEVNVVIEAKNIILFGNKYHNVNSLSLTESSSVSIHENANIEVNLFKVTSKTFVNNGKIKVQVFNGENVIFNNKNFFQADYFKLATKDFKTDSPLTLRKIFILEDLDLNNRSLVIRELKYNGNDLINNPLENMTIKAKTLAENFKLEMKSKNTTIDLSDGLVVKGTIYTTGNLSIVSSKINIVEQIAASGNIVLNTDSLIIEPGKPSDNTAKLSSTEGKININANASIIIPNNLFISAKKDITFKSSKFINFILPDTAIELLELTNKRVYTEYENYIIQTGIPIITFRLSVPPIVGYHMLQEVISQGNPEVFKQVIIKEMDNGDIAVFPKDASKKTYQQISEHFNNGHKLEAQMEALKAINISKSIIYSIEGKVTINAPLVISPENVIVIQR